MKSKHAKREFERHLASRGLEVSKLTPDQGVDAMLSFYRDVRAGDCNVAEQGDMLLYQWGVYDWGKGSRFELDLTRQFVAGGGEDEDIWQLHLTFRFEPANDLQAVGEGNRWCQSPAELETFAGFITSHPAKAAVEHRSGGAVEIYYEQAG